MAAYLTQEGYNKKMEELAALEAQRPSIKQAIAEARDKGDLSENAEYDAAKEAQGMLEMKIAKLKEARGERTHTRRQQAEHRGGAASQ